ncbi:testis-specific serine/threonine-protein kinase 4-like isoform X3 [Plodia interpunctella]|uniref:testis-specific serine/threonine-protein kinase 4-like isoform X3 n=1 Tax=Plodia interpunctella TaxID=58824 RepID=UPI00236783AE|nr:testis-specific serine/threonine-protein kinase 4-like isoform X3 [Plodia interpunctella]
MPGPDVRANENVFGEMSTEPAATLHSGTETKPDRKLTVLETHGYVLGRTIGSGSYATVKVATSERHNCQVAVKIISKFQAPGDYLKKFLPREIEVVKGLKHENLIRFLQAIETTHRDIKCENLLMDHGLNIKLSDFGFARGHMKPKNGVYSLSETFCGSYAYASPEILKGVPYRPQDSDIWSMGVVLYAIVYGRLPFDDTNYTQLLKQVQNKVSFPREPKVSTECRKLITRILAPLKVRLKIPQILADPWLNPNQPSKDEEVDAQDKEVNSKEEIKSVNIGTVTFDRKLEEVK